MLLFYRCTAIARLVDTNRASAVYTFYMIALVLLLWCVSSIKKIDSAEKQKETYKSVYLGKLKKCFITGPEGKERISVKALVLEIAVYICFLITAFLFAVSWMLEVYLISMISWFWLLFVIVHTGITYIVRIKTLKPNKLIDY